MVVIPNPIVAASSRQRFRDIAVNSLPQRFGASEIVGKAPQRA
jgi:hypothetical protein